MKIKKFVRTHKIALSVIAGSITGTTLGLYHRKKIDEQPKLASLSDTIHYMSPRQVRAILTEGGHVEFETEHGNVKVSIMEDQNED